MLPKGFLFDFDGVVVNSFKSHFSAGGSAFKELFNVDIAPYPKSLVVVAPIKIAAYFCGLVNQPQKAEDLFLLKDKHLDIYFTTPEILPGVPEITSFLTAQNIPYGIASNATRLFIKNCIEKLNLNFETYFGVEDYEKPKPAPEAYITLAKSLGFTEKDFKNIWVFEDSLTGTTAAKLAGMQPIGILTQYSEEELKKAGSTLTFPTLLEAYNYLQTSNKS